MADGPSSSAAPRGDSEHGVWRGLRTLIFGAPEESLRDQLEEAIDRHEGDPSPDATGDLSPLERQMVRNLLHFGASDSGDVGVPRADIIAVEQSIPFTSLVQAFAEAGHSRLPVFRTDLDHVVGMVHVKDVFALLARGEAPADWSALIREPLYVPVAMGALDLLAEMRGRHVHLAIVLDEYGGTEGVVTIEDLIEEIVGDIEDEHDEATAALLVPLDGGGWAADGRAELEEVGELIDPRLAETEEDVDTLAGLAAVLAGHVPEVGAVLVHPSGWRLEIVEADTRRVGRLHLHPPVSRIGPDED